MLCALLRRCAATKLIGSQVPIPLFTELTPDNRDQKMTSGRAWRATELRLKSDDDLHKLWYVLLREKNVLMADNQAKVQHKVPKGPQDRMSKVKQTMARILTVVRERELVREAYIAALDKEYMDTHFPAPPAKPKTPRLLTEREQLRDAKRREAIKSIPNWRSMTNPQRRSSIKQQYARMAKEAKTGFINELRFIGQLIKDKQQTTETPKEQHSEQN